jgi:hypothetical protein
VAVAPVSAVTWASENVRGINAPTTIQMIVASAPPTLEATILGDTGLLAVAMECCSGMSPRGTRQSGI